MKKFTALLLALALLCGLAGCGRQQTVRQPGNDDASSAATRPEPPRAPGVSDLPDETPDEPDEPETPDGALQPEDYLGSWDGNVYSNKALNLSFTLPEGWVYASDEELLEMVDRSASNDLLSDRTKLATELGKRNLSFALFAQDLASGANVQLAYMNLAGYIGFDTMTEEKCAEMIAEQQGTMFSEELGATIQAGETYRATLGGEEFLVLPFDMTISGVEMKQLGYIRLLEDRIALISFSAVIEEEEMIERGVSAFAPLGAGGPGGSGSDISGGSDAGSSGTSGAPTAVGDIGRKFSTMFFDYTVIAAESPDQYSGYAPANGNRLVVVRVKVKNDFGSTLPMYDTDFQLQWGAGDDDYAWAVDAFNDKMMPLEWELADGKEATYDMLFEAPANITDFSLCYLEEYTDANGNDKTGEFYEAKFTLLSPAAA